MDCPLRTLALAVTALSAAAYVSVSLAERSPSDESPSTVGRQRRDRAGRRPGCAGRRHRR